MSDSNKSQTDSAAQDKREQLSKALGAAFLSHQVESLEKSVDSLTFSRDGRLLRSADSPRGGRSHGRGQDRLSSQQVKKTHNGGKRPVKVIDVSVLVHALPVVKRWLREDTHQLIVPLQAFSTLDILKKAPFSLREKAAEATRFLESQLAIANRIESALGGPGIDADAKIRLRAQRQSEEVGWDQVEHLYEVPSDAYPLVTDESKEVDEEEEETGLPPCANDLPRFTRSPLQCALHFASVSSHNTLILFNTLHAPTATTCLPPESTSMTGARPTPPPMDYLAISSGDTLTSLAQTHFGKSMKIYVVPSSEVVAAKEWLKAMAQQQQANGAGSTASKEAPSRRGRGGRDTGRGATGSGRGNARSASVAERGRGGRGRSRDSSDGKLFVP